MGETAREEHDLTAPRRDTYLPPFALTALMGLLMPMARSRAPDFIIGGEADPYLRRWHLTPKGDGPAVYLHQFVRSDDDRALHDHPWPSCGILLDGSYMEHLEGGEVAIRMPGDIIERAPESAHRVQLLRDDAGDELPVWTLFLTGPRVRDWGFHCPNGWVHWRDFTAGTDGELVGRGCG